MLCNENPEVISEDVEYCLHIVNTHLWQNCMWVKFMSFLKQGNNIDVLVNLVIHTGQSNTIQRPYFQL